MVSEHWNPTYIRSYKVDIFILKPYITFAKGAAATSGCSLRFDNKNRNANAVLRDKFPFCCRKKGH